MVQGYAQKDRRGNSGWQTFGVGAIEYIHNQLVAKRDEGSAVLLVSFELDEVMNLADRILVMYEGEIVGQLDPKTTTVQELGLYMAGAKREKAKEEVQ